MWLKGECFHVCFWIFPSEISEDWVTEERNRKSMYTKHHGMATEGQDCSVAAVSIKRYIMTEIPPSQRIRFRSLLRLKLVQATASVARNWRESDPYQGAPFYTRDSSEVHGLMGRLFRWAFSWCLAISVKPSCRPSFLCKNSQKRLGIRQDKSSKVLQTRSCDHRQLKLTIPQSKKIQLSAIDLSIV